ncbi:MAG TPA: APC family permease [Acidobacteriota bacterium]|jgi:amino acid transporter
MAQPELKKALGLLDLILFNIVAIVGLRWIAVAAAGGVSSISLWVLAMLLFFIPQGLVVLELSTRFPEEGGLYQWTKRAFGPFHGFLSGWCYWTNNLIYYPSLLIFVAGVSVYVAGPKYPSLGERPAYVFCFSLVILWMAILLNVVGLDIGKWVQNLGAIGTWIPAAIVAVAGTVALYRLGAANSFEPLEFLPVKSYKTMGFWASLCFGFAGLELASVMGDEIKDPRKNIPRAILISGVAIALIYILGTAALLVVLPKNEVSVISGAIQAIASVSRRLDWHGITALSALCMTLGGLGGAGAWLAGSARVPFVAGLDRYLPGWFGRVHPRWQTPYAAILAQGLLSTFFVSTSLWGGTVKDAYLVLVDTTIIVYFVPYIYLFASIFVLPPKADDAEVMLIPGGSLGRWLTACAGLVSTLAAIALAVVPPEGVENPARFRLKVIGGCILFIASGAGIYARASRRHG